MEVRMDMDTLHFMFCLLCCVIIGRQNWFLGESSSWKQFPTAFLEFHSREINKTFLCERLAACRARNWGIRCPFQLASQMWRELAKFRLGSWGEIFVKPTLPASNNVFQQVECDLKSVRFPTGLICGVYQIYSNVSLECHSRESNYFLPPHNVSEQAEQEM